ncbi:MAG: phenylalanine--tRNA ligase subunit beta [Actinomycetes bacterium]
MKFPLSWIQDFTPVPTDIDLELLEDAFVRVGFEVESIERVGNDVVGPLIVAKVVSIEEVTGQKKPIRYVGLDCGEVDIRYVICGATNFTIGDLVVASLPGAVLPGDFAISARQTYGKVSNGMICSARELRLSDDHAGIIVLPSDSEIGSDAIALLQINDVLVDVAVNADRGYALSIRGLARELAASLALPFEDPIGAIDADKYLFTDEAVPVHIEDTSAASVIYLRTLNSFQAKAESPLWMRRRIEKCGMRAISLAVDITNYVMLELGQPLHAFDRDRVNGALHIRRAKNDKFLTTLDGQKRNLHEDDLVVADDIEPLALAGTMGGLSSEVTPATVSLVIEAARFDPISIAKNSRRHKLSSEASRRLERGVDPSLAKFASARAVDLLTQYGGAMHLGSAMAGEPRYSPIVDFDPHFVSRLLGTEVGSDVVAEKLRIVGCDIEMLTANHWRVDPPSWRSDLLAGPDFVEEVARMIGYDSIPSTLPMAKSGSTLSPLQIRKRTMTTLMSNIGFAEVLTSPFVSEAMMSTLGLDDERGRAFRIANPMSEDFPYLRTHLAPGLTSALVRNLARGAKDVAIFEVGSIFLHLTALPIAENVSTLHRPSDAILAKIYAGVPHQPLHLGAIFAGNLESRGWWGAGRKGDWSDAISLAVRLVEESGNDVQVHAVDIAPWHPGRGAELRVNDVVIGHAGELHPRVIANLELPYRTCMFVLNLSAIPFAPVKRALPVWTMPAAFQDISLIVDAHVAASDVERALRSGAGELLESIVLFDRYDKVDEGKVSLAYSLTFRAPDRTLTAEEVSGYREAAGAAAQTRLGAIIRS